MKPRRKRTRKDSKHALNHQLPIRWSEVMLERAEQAAQIVTEHDREHVTATEILRDGGNRYVDAILAAHRQVDPRYVDAILAAHRQVDPSQADQRGDQRRQRARRVTDSAPTPLPKSA